MTDRAARLKDLSTRIKVWSRQCAAASSMCGSMTVYRPSILYCMRRQGRPNLHRSADAARRTSCPRDRAQSHGRARSRHGRGRHGRATQGACWQIDHLADVRRVRQSHRPPAGAEDVVWRTIHRDPPSLASRSTKSEVFETGIKVIDVLVPLERGGKAGLFGGAGRRQDRLAHRDDSQHGRTSEGSEHVLRHRRAMSRRRRALP